MAEAKITVTDNSISVNPPVIEVTEEEVVVTAGITGPQGPPGESDKHFEFTQSTPSDEWTIEHHMNKKPAVTIVDSGGTEWQAEVEHLSENVCVAKFAFPFSGKAYLN